MTQAQSIASFEDYLTYSENLEGRFHLIEGELVELPPESPENDLIARELFWLLALANLAPRALIRTHTCEVQVPVLQPQDTANRYPDLVILRPEHLDLMERRLTITIDMPSPQLIVEVVSPGRTNQDRDYIQKRAQYAAIGVGEYWLIAPATQTVLVLELRDQDYAEVGTFQSNEPIISPTFPDLMLTAAQIFQR